MRSLRIIVVMVEPPLPFGNAAARQSYVLLKGLVERGHRVTAFATCSRAADIEEAGHVFPAPHYDLRCYAHAARQGLRAKWGTFLKPHSYLFSAKMRLNLELELEKGFDVLHLEQLWSGWLGMSHVSKVLLNIHYLPSIDWAKSSESIRERAHRALALRGERKLLHCYPRISALTPRLTECVGQMNSTASVHTIPLGIDLALYEFTSPALAQAQPTVSLIGSFDWLPTRSAAVRIVTRLWPAIRAACPDAVLQFIGHNAGSALREFKNDLRLHGVSVAENVADILPHFRATEVLLYPAQQASGMKVKVLEAFALGAPVVTTTEGIEGLPAEDGIHAGIANDDTGLIERTVHLLRSPDVRQRQRIAARQLVEDHCSPTRVLDGLEAVYEEMLRANSHSAGRVAAVTAASRPKCLRV
jgi:glycosyltransferase involved in cell wall biosynthesis